MTGTERLRDRREFAETVRCLMDDRDLTAAGLAERAQLDCPIVEAILAARHPIWLDEIHLLAGALGVTPGELIDKRPREAAGNA